MNSLTQSAMQSAEDLNRKLVNKAVEDSAFRQQLVSDPKNAIQQALGIDLPEGIQVHVHESDMNTIHLSIPPGELDEEQLEAVAAGRCCC